jgi:membrane-bound lytic murein transglycosylase D
MQQTKQIRFRPKIYASFFLAIFSIIGSYAFCQDSTGIANSTERSFSKEKKICSKDKESNIIFPVILRGNEEESLDYIEKFSNRRKAYLVRMYNKGKTLLPKTAKILKKYKLPEELKMLLPLESAYNPNAISKAGAVGYWQIMDEVAREYGLKCAEKERVVVKCKKGSRKKIKIRLTPDDRMNFAKSTVTAARYLHARRLNLDDNWLLVVASYNCGVGNVWAAMKKTGKSNPDFWDVKKYLPAETRSYVMNFITLNVIFSNYDNFVKNKLIFKTVKIENEEEDADNISAATATSAHY